MTADSDEGTPVDPIDEELGRVLADPDVRARLDAYLERERRGDLGPGIPHDEVGRRLGLLDDAAEEPEDPWGMEPDPGVFGRSLGDLPDHLRVYHGWSTADVTAEPGHLRRMHYREHSREQRDHLTIDWSRSR